MRCLRRRAQSAPSAQSGAILPCAVLTPYGSFCAILGCLHRLRRLQRLLEICGARGCETVRDGADGGDGARSETTVLCDRNEIFTSLRDGNRPHRIVGQPLVTANDVGH